MNKLQRFNCRKSNWARLNLQWPITLFLILFCLPILFGQQTLKGKKISYSHPELATTFNVYEVHELEMTELTELTNGTEQEEILFNLDLGSHNWQLNLVSNPLIAPGLKTTVLTDNGVAYRDINRTYTYKGYVNGDPNSKVRMSIYDDRIIGMIKANDDEYFIEQLATLLEDNTISSNQYVVYKIADVIPDPSLRCGGVKAHSKSGHQQHLNSSQPGNGGSSGSILMTCMEVDFALAAANDMVVRFGSVAAVQTEILDITNMMEALYDDFMLTYIVTEIVIPATLAADPWTRSQQMDELLDETDPPFDGLPGFEPWAAAGFANPHDIGQLWVNRDVISDFSGSGLIGRAGGIGVVCSPQQYNVCEYFTTGMNGLRSLSAHENGHLWDGEHGLATPSVTIMSAIIATNATDWAAGNLTQMQAHIDSRTCLSACSSCDIAITGSAATPTSCIGLDDGTITLTATSALPITYSIAGPDGPAPVVTNTTGIFTGLAPGNYTARAEQTGDATCSEVVNIEVLTGPCDINFTEVTPTAETCPAADDGRIDATATFCGGGTVRYDIVSMTNAAFIPMRVTGATATFFPLPPGTYVITATNNADGACFAQISAEVMPAACDISIDGVTAVDESCDDAMDGSITAVASHCGAFTYTLTGPDGPAVVGSNATGMFTGLADGTYVVTATSNADATCTTMATAVVMAGPTLIVDCTNVVDETLTCRADLPPVDFSLPVVLESCGDPILSALTIIPGNSGCPGDEVLITRTYFIQDDAGNMAECMQTFTIRSDNGPSFTFCPASTTVNCGDDTSEATLGSATATADCSAPTVTSADVVTPGCGATSVIIRTWTATDFCNRTATCSQTITVQDNVPPVITCPANATIECDDDSTPAGTGMATAVDNCGGPVTITFADATIPGGTCPQIFTIQRTFTATDECGLVSQCTQMISVLDSDPPMITVPGPLTISCEVDRTPAGLGSFATATDNCDADVAITFTDVFVAGACPQAGTLTRTWRATDDCGLFSEGDQIITITDNVAPVLITCPSNMNIECDQPTTPDFTGRPVASDNCDTELVSTFVDVVTPGVCDQEMTITRTWTVTDDCGNTTGCVQVLNITDETAPIITCPASIIVECDQNTAPGNVMTGMATATNAANLTWGDGTSGPIGSISLAAAGAPAGAVVTNVTIQMDIDHSFTADLELELEGPDGTTVMLISDECFGNNNVSATFTDAGAPLACVTTGAGTDVGTPDDCSNDYLAGAAISGMILPESALAGFNGIDPNGTWLLNVVDDAGGDGGCVINVNLVVSWSFTAPGSGVTGVATAVDNCDPMPVITSSDFIIPGDCVNEFTIERTWVATDNCGNISSCTQTIFVQDTTDPVITCPADVTIECDVDRSPATNGTATATDNCTADADIIITFADNIIPGPCANTFTIERTWTATDECDLFSTCLQVINVEDTTAPVAPAPPANITVQCPQEIPVPMPLTAIDNCAGPITVLPTSEVTNQECATRFTFTYTWTFDDGCGNVTAISQVIQVIDNAPLVITSSPPNQVVDCQVNVIPQEHLVEAMSPCGNPPTITSSISDPIGTLGCNGTRYIITYTVADDCGRVVTTTQTYTIQNDGPEILCGNEVCYLPCGVTGEEVLATFNEFADRAVVVDACEESVYTVTNNFNPNALGDCGNVTIVTFTATDACGRRGTCTVPVIVVDDMAPTVSGPVTPAIRECDDITGLQYISWINNTIESLNATDNCGEVSVSYEPLMPNTTFEDGFPYARTEVTFTFSDECGNDLLVPGLFKLKNNHPPTFIGELEDQMITCPATPQFDTPVFIHGCGGATLTFSDDSSGGSCPGGYTVTRTWTVTDGTGAASTIQQTIFVMGSNTQMSTVAGLIITEMDEPVEDVAVALNYSGTSFAQEEMTAQDGLYNFATPANNDYEIQPNRNDDPLNGVTTYDLILLGQHLLNIQSLNSPYQMIAGDVNKSGTITNLDMIELRRLILLIDDEFTNNTSWRFVEADHEFVNASNPFAETFPETSMINDLTGELASDFIAIKIGDLNNSAQPNQLVAGDTRSKDSELIFQLEDKIVEAGETFSVAFDATDFEQILGYQFTLKYNADQVSFEDMEANELRSLNADNFGFKTDKGVITTSWNRETPLSLTKGATAFTLTFTAKERVSVSDVIAMDDAYTPAEAYNAANDLMDVQLRFGEVAADEKSVFRLFQNQPNPFRTETKIGFQLPENGTATLVIYDVAGRVLRTITKDYSAGYNEEVIQQSDLNATGILFYRLETDHGVATKKMILK